MSEQPNTSAEDDIKIVLQNSLMQIVKALLAFTRTEAFALQIPETETHIFAGPLPCIAQFVDQGGVDWRPYQSALSRCAELLDNMSEGDQLVDAPRFLAEKLAQLVGKPAGDDLVGNVTFSAESLVEFVRAAIAAHMASQSQAAQPSELTDEQAWKIATELFGTIQYAWRGGEHVELGDAADAGEFARAAIAAHLAGTSQATKVQAEPKPSFFVIADNNGIAEFVTNHRHAAQEHINEACADGVEGADKWKAIPVFKMRPTDDELWEQTIGERDHHQDWADKLAGAIAPYAERIRQLEAAYDAATSLAADTINARNAEVAEQAERIRLLEKTAEVQAAALESRKKIDALKQKYAPAQSIDTPEFRELNRAHREAFNAHAALSGSKEVCEAWGNLIAHIDGRTARVAPEGYVLAPAEPTEAMVHAAQDLPPPRMFGVVYRAMIAAAPSHSPAEEGK